MISNELNDQNISLDSYSSRLKYAMKLREVSYAQIANAIGTARQSIRNLCVREDTKGSKLTIPIAEYLEINSEWLAHGKGSIDKPNLLKAIDQNNYRVVPIINWEQALQLANGSFEATITPELPSVLCSSSLSDNCFALKINDNSMSPRFDKKTVIVIDPTVKPRDQSFVLAYIKKQKEIIFREYILENGIALLHPMNTALYKVVPFTNDDLLLGVMMESRWVSQ